MRVDEELLRFEGMAEFATRGTSIAGAVVVTAPVEARAVRVELVRTERSSSYAGTTEDVFAEQQIAGPTSLSGGERFAFSLAVPFAAVPGFESPHGSLTWSVRVRVDVHGSDPVASRPVLIGEAPSDLDVTGPTREIALQVVADATQRRCRADQRQARWLGWIFAGFGACFLVAGAVWSSDPPEKWNGSRAPLWLTLGIGALLAGCGAIVLVVNRDRSGVPIRLSTDRLGYRPGQRVQVVATNPTGRTYALALQQVEVRLRVTGSARSRRVDAPQHVMWEEVRELPPGELRCEFTVPADASASYGGDTIAIAHRVVVHGTGRGRRRPPLAERHVVVVR